MKPMRCLPDPRRMPERAPYPELKIRKRMSGGVHSATRCTLSASSRKYTDHVPSLATTSGTTVMTDVTSANEIATTAARFAAMTLPAPSAFPTRAPAAIAMPSGSAYMKYAKLTKTVWTAVACREPRARFSFTPHVVGAARAAASIGREWWALLGRSAPSRRRRSQQPLRFRRTTTRGRPCQRP